jgi:16S rRNA (cytidine1402-2'-O)-methyltransferase
LGDLGEIFGVDRRAAVARELSKLNEQVARGTLAELAAAIGGQIPLRGEFVLIVGGNPVERQAGDEAVLDIYRILAAELAPDRAVALTARIAGRRRNQVYALTRT